MHLLRSASRQPKSKPGHLLSRDAPVSKVRERQFPSINIFASSLTSALHNGSFCFCYVLSMWPNVISNCNWFGLSKLNRNMQGFILVFSLVTTAASAPCGESMKYRHIIKRRKKYSPIILKLENNHSWRIETPKFLRSSRTAKWQHYFTLLEKSVETPFRTGERDIRVFHSLCLVTVKIRLPIISGPLSDSVPTLQSLEPHLGQGKRCQAPHIHSLATLRLKPSLGWLLLCMVKQSHGHCAADSTRSLSCILWMWNACELPFSCRVLNYCQHELSFPFFFEILNALAVWLNVWPVHNTNKPKKQKQIYLGTFVGKGKNRKQGQWSMFRKHKVVFSIVSSLPAPLPSFLLSFF